LVRVDGFHVALFQRAAGIRRLLVDLKGTQSIGVVSLKGWGEVFQDKENPLKFHLHGRQIASPDLRKFGGQKILGRISEGDIER